MTTLAVITACVLAFSNGANDNAKGVATLIGSRTLPLDRSLVYAAVTTLLGSVTSVLIAGALVARFSGNGLISGSVPATPAFASSVGLAAATTILLATRIGMPVSTTHALVGGIVGVGLSAHALNVPAVLSVFLVPLLVSPIIAMALAVTAYHFFRRARTWLGVSAESCICIDRSPQSLGVTGDGTASMATVDLSAPALPRVFGCALHPDGRATGLNAKRMLDCAHVFSAGAIGFARGLNDTPKIAALVLATGAMTSGASMVAVGVAIAIGGLIAVKRVAQTVSYKITDMNDGQAFTANLVTAALVIVASRFGVPVSTTHVSCGSLFGIGIVNRRAHVKVIGHIVLAWVGTLPVAATVGWIAWRLLGG